MSTTRLTVIYIAGSGRSGSTLLERMLGQLENLTAVGELRHCWQRGFIENQLCGCGRPVNQCEFWQAVMTAAFEGIDLVDAPRIVALQRKVDRVRHIPLVLSSVQPPAYAGAARQYRQVLLRVYQTVADISGSRIIVDSSKDISTPFHLTRDTEIDLCVIHLVRDSRAVSFSWQRHRQRPEIIQSEVYMPLYGPAWSAWDWTIRNLGAAWLQSVVPRHICIRYEDLVARPIETLHRIFQALDLGTPRLDFIQGTTLHLDRDSHTTSGNPVRFKRGLVELQPDTEWESAMSPGNCRLVTLLTWPLLLRYGYPIRIPSDS